jgi:orotidine-5'-phosphate decarboxylase
METPMPDNFADRLLKAIKDKGSPVCVGLDPLYEKLPAQLRPDNADAGAKVQAIAAYCRAVLELVAPYVPAVKPQSAYFEMYGCAGVAAYEQSVQYARQLGLLVIGDVKRNDIGSTAQAYAAGHLLADETPDAITVNGYLGGDGIAPFVQSACQTGKGIFVLVRTSNPSAKAVQDIASADGKKVYQHVAEMVAKIGSEAHLVGQAGYSCVGAVVGATYPQEAAELRAMMPQQIFLVPGYGAQGGTAKDCAASFKADGTGGIVNASRSVIFAYNDKKHAGKDWKQAIADAARDFAADIAQAVGPG